MLKDSRFVRRRPHGGGKPNSPAASAPLGKARARCRYTRAFQWPQAARKGHPGTSGRTSPWLPWLPWLDCLPLPRGPPDSLGVHLKGKYAKVPCMLLAARNQHIQPRRDGVEEFREVVHNTGGVVPVAQHIQEICRRPE